ncbi:carboxypeptidase B1-like [Leptinotarsa decemlineata]|uniref:carboxypeptidase B1-like n=1 Tax=Leptinotarsa decemlineata TaxID=7539 RepID=UPI003D30540F
MKSTRKKRKIIPNKRKMKKPKYIKEKSPSLDPMNSKHPSVTKNRYTVRSYEQCHDKFLTYDQIKEFLIKMATKYPSKIELQVIGNSTEGRPIYLVIISDDSSDDTKLATLIEAGSNGCDWMAISTALFLIDFLTKNNSLSKIMDYFILPCSNPDAYHKTMNITNSSNPNILMNIANNFPVTLGLFSTKFIQTDDFLKAIKLWKENFQYKLPETMALLKVISNYQFAVKLLISLQENGEQIVYPFGICREEVFDAEDLKKIAKSGQMMIKRRCFQVGSIYQLCGLTFGSLVDYLKIRQTSIKFTYILHLGNKKGDADPKNILSCGEDILNCIKIMAKNVYMFYHKSDKMNTNNE